MQFITRLKVGFIETRGGESLEVTKEDRKATRSEGMGLEESASRALMRQGGGEGCGGRG